MSQSATVIEEDVLSGGKAFAAVVKILSGGYDLADVYVVHNSAIRYLLLSSCTFNRILGRYRGAGVLYASQRLALLSRPWPHAIEDTG